MRLLVVLLILSISIWGEPLKIGTITLPAKVRDFLEYNKGGHPDFENYLPIGDYDGCKGVVLPRISESGKSSGFPGDNRTPVMNPDYDCSPFEHYSGTNMFIHWFDDYYPEINRPFQVGLTFDIYDDCKIRYENRAFFPIDDGASKKKLSEHDTFGHLQELYPEHNFGFTLEFHTTFTYIRGANQTFHFEGDDDVWVFINDSLVIDLGGLHAPMQASVNMDDMPPGFFFDGKEYSFDLFFAERHSWGSNLIIESGLLFGMKMGGIPGKGSRVKFMECYDQLVEIPHESVLEQNHGQVNPFIMQFDVTNRELVLPYETEPGTIYVRNMMGREVAQIQGDNNNRFILENLASGTYAITFKNQMLELHKSVVIP